MVHPVCPYKMTVQYRVVRAYRTLQILIHCISRSLLWKSIFWFYFSFCYCLATSWIYQLMPYNIPEDLYLYQHCCEDLKSWRLNVFLFAGIYTTWMPTSSLLHFDLMKYLCFGLCFANVAISSTFCDTGCFGTNLLHLMLRDWSLTFLCVPRV